jgi:hypothetical protein
VNGRAAGETVMIRAATCREAAFFFRIALSGAIFSDAPCVTSGAERSPIVEDILVLEGSS